MNAADGVLLVFALVYGVLGALVLGEGQHALAIVCWVYAATEVGLALQ